MIQGIPLAIHDRLADMVSATASSKTRMYKSLIFCLRKTVMFCYLEKVTRTVPYFPYATSRKQKKAEEQTIEM